MRHIFCSLFAVLTLGTACSGAPDGDNNNANQNNNTDRVLCGDGVIQGAEECDEGSQNSDTRPNACRTDCTLPRCGDGVVDDDEACDGGPANSNVVPDACRSDCTLPRCGDGVVDVASGELCDDGNLTAGDGCSAVCQVEYCGNGILDPGEVCDDGNFISGDGCNPDCITTCGDGVLDPNETCDTEPQPSWSCLDFGFDRGQIGCSNLCTPDFAGCGFVGWKQEHSGTTVTLRGVWGSSPDDVWAVGDQGTALHYDGQTWNAVPTPLAVNLNALWGSGPNSVWAVGAAGTVLHWNGVLWSEQDVGTGVALYTIWGSGPNDIWVGGAHTSVLHFDGTQWTTRLVGATSHIRAIWGSSATNIVIGVDSGHVLHFNGTSWQSRSLGILTMPRSFAGRADDDLFLGSTTGGGCRIYHFDGSQWTLLTSIIGGAPSLQFIGDHLLAGSTTNTRFPLALHSDGAWRDLMVPGEASGVHSIWSAHPGHGVAVGSLGMILRHYQASWTAPVAATAESRLTTPLVRGPDRTLWAGHSGLGLASFQNGEWTSTPSLGVTVDVFDDLWVSPSNVVWIATHDVDTPVIIRYDSGVVSLPTLNTTLEGSLRSIWGASDSALFAVGNEGVVLSYQGSSWTEIRLESTSTTWNRVRGLSESLVYTVGGDYITSAGLVSAYDGTSWTAEALPPGTPSLHDLWVSPTQDVFVVGLFGTILHFDGTQWETMPTPTTANLYAVWGTAPDNVFAAGFGGVFLHFNGIEWTRVRSPTDDTLHSIMGLDQTLYVRGSDHRVHELIITAPAL